MFHFVDQMDFKSAALITYLLGELGGEVTFKECVTVLFTFSSLKVT